MIRFFLWAVAGLSAVVCHAGIENELLSANYGDCDVRVTHDATPDARVGTVIFRSYRPVDGIHHACPPAPRVVIDSLGKAMERYADSPDLKPVTSVFIGRLIAYPWIKAQLEVGGESGLSHPKLTHNQFGLMLMESGLLRPFAGALKPHGYIIPRASCEKLMFFANGVPRDAMCWLVIEKPPWP